MSSHSGCEHECVHCIVTKQLRSSTKGECHCFYNPDTNKINEIDTKPEGYEADHIIALVVIVHVFCTFFVYLGPEVPEWLKKIAKIANSSDNLCWIPKNMNDNKENEEAKSRDIQNYLITTLPMWKAILKAINEVNKDFSYYLIDYFTEKHGLVFI